MCAAHLPKGGAVLVAVVPPCSALEELNPAPRLWLMLQLFGTAQRIAMLRHLAAVAAAAWLRCLVGSRIKGWHTAPWALWCATPATLTDAGVLVRCGLDPEVLRLHHISGAQLGQELIQNVVAARVGLQRHEGLLRDSGPGMRAVPVPAPSSDGTAASAGNGWAIRPAPESAGQPL